MSQTGVDEYGLHPSCAPVPEFFRHLLHSLFERQMRLDGFSGQCEVFTKLKKILFNVLGRQKLESTKLYFAGFE